MQYFFEGKAKLRNGKGKQQSSDAVCKFFFYKDIYKMLNMKYVENRKKYR